MLASPRSFGDTHMMSVDDLADLRPFNLLACTVSRLQRDHDDSIPCTLYNYVPHLVEVLLLHADSSRQQLRSPRCAHTWQAFSIAENGNLYTAILPSLDIVVH